MMNDSWARIPVWVDGSKMELNLRIGSNVQVGRLSVNGVIVCAPEISIDRIEENSRYSLGSHTVLSIMIQHVHHHRNINHLRPYCFEAKNQNYCAYVSHSLGY